MLLAVQRPTPLAEGVMAVATLAAELARETAVRVAGEGQPPVGVGLAVGGQVDVFRQRVVGRPGGFRAGSRCP